MASAALALGSAGLSMLGGLFGNKGAEEALKLIQQGKVDSSALNYLLYGQTRQDQAPYMGAGANAMNYLSYLLGIGGAPGGQSTSSYDPHAKLNQVTGMGAGYKSSDKLGALGDGFYWVPDSGNKRTYTFLYNDGVNDVYQRSGGGEGSGMNIDFAIVGKDGKVNFTGTPPMMGQNAPKTTGAPAGSQNDPMYGSLMKDFGASDFTADPGYQFRLSEGMKALERSSAAKGTVFSGGTQKELADYNQNFASNEFMNSYNRFRQNKLDKMNALLGVAGLGQVSTNAVTGQTGQLQGNLTNITMQAAGDSANARASGYSSLANGITGAGNSLLNWYQMSQMNKQGNSLPLGLNGGVTPTWNPNPLGY